MSFLKEKEVILFQGDSVTDCGRNRDALYDMGNGYPLLVGARLSAAYTGCDFTFINKAISGNRTCDLVARWDADCVNLRPTVVSILIGINDTWRKFDSNDPTDAKVFEKHYRDILTRTARETEARLVLLEPFVLPVYEDQKQWRADLDPKIQVIRQLSLEFGARYVPLDGMFAAASALKSPEFWAADGVHPSNAGHGLIAEAWLQAVSAN